MNDTEVSIKFKNSITNEKRLEKYAETLTKINSMLNGFNTGTIRQIESSSNSMSSIAQATTETSEKISTAFNVATITRFAGAIKKLGASFTSLAKQSFDYLENFNLFQVAFKGNYTEAERFVNKMSEMYGLDESWLTQTIGKFKQLTNAMQLTEETGQKVSKLLTQMSLDISSLYNVDIDRAAATLSSAMAGQTKPIRGVTGGDITQATLQTTLDQLGINAAVSQLSFAEKRLLIIISLTKQLNASIGDMGRTIESPANQLRIMNEQWERLTRAVGNVFLPILSKVLPYLNAILMVLTEIISTIALLVGYKRDDFDYFDSAATGAWDLDEGMKSAGASAKKLKQGLRGFDKLNVITTPTKAGGSSGIGAGGVNPKIMAAFNAAFDEYQNKLKKVEMTATKIRDIIMNWLGFTKHTAEGTDDVYFTLDKGVNRFKVLVGLVGTLVGFKLLKGLTGLITGTSKLGKLLGTGGLYTSITKIVKAVSTMGLKGGLLSIFQSSKLGQGITTLTSGFGKLAGALGLSSGALLGIVAAIAAVVAAFIYAYKHNDTFREKVDNLVATIKESLIPVFETIKETLKMIWEQVLVPLWNDVIKPLARLLVDVLTPIFEVIVDILQVLFEKIIKPIMPVLKTIATFLLQNLINNIKIGIKIIQKVIEVVSWLWKNIVTPLIDFLKNIAIWVIERISDNLEIMFAVLKAVIQWFKDKYDKWIKPIIVEVKKDIEILKTAVVSFYEEKIKPIIDKIKTKIEEFKKAWDLVKQNFKLPELKLPKFPKIKLSVTYETNVGATKKAIYKALGLDGWPKLNFSTYAKGGLPPAGQLFVANEKGAELVGNIGGQSFVANQNQVVDLLDRKLGQANANPLNATFIIQVGSKEVAKQVINDLQDMAKTNGRPITIGG